MNKLGFVFRSYPHTSARGREGLDALLAASAYSEDIAVFFIGDGVTQLLSGQTPEVVHSRNYIAAFKLMSLYDVEQVYICQQSLQDMGLAQAELVLDGEKLSQQAIAAKLAECDKIITF